MSYFKNVPEVKYEGKKSKNPFAYRFYNPDEVIMGKTMREHLRFAMAWWHTLTMEGADPFGSATLDRSYGQTEQMARAKVRADAGFEMMEKLDIDFFCFHDNDLIPNVDSIAEYKENLDEITDYVKGLMDKTGKKLLWGTSNCFNAPRFMSGAATSPNAESFAFAAAQIKNCIDATMKLGGNGYVFWGGREGYDTLINTDMGLELDNLARMLTMSRDYARAKGFKGDFYIEPKAKEPTSHQYDFDTATAVAFCKKYGLDKDFRMNIEHNHALLAGHTMQHELRTARINGMFGSVDANQGDPMIGWDVDMFPSNVYDATFAMYEVLKAGGFTNGGLNFDAKVRRASYTPEDIALAHITGMDTYAMGLRCAAAIIEDGRLDQFIEDRYASWKTGIGADIIAGKATLESLEAYALNAKNPVVASGKQEYLENMINSIMFSL